MLLPLLFPIKIFFLSTLTCSESVKGSFSKSSISPISWQSSYMCFNSSSVFNLVVCWCNRPQASTMHLQFILLRYKGIPVIHFAELQWNTSSITKKCPKLLYSKLKGNAGVGDLCRLFCTFHNTGVPEWRDRFLYLLDNNTVRKSRTSLLLDIDGFIICKYLRARLCSPWHMRA